MKNTADIVVIGGGPAGVATALEASKNGASVLLLEADTLLGGNAARSTGYLAFQGFEMQHREGLNDNAEIFFKDMVNEIKRQEETYGIEFDAELARVFAKESASTYDWLVELGFEFNRFLPRPLQHSVNRMVDVTDTSMFTKVFSDVLEKNDVDVRTSTRARRLLLEDNQIVGVQTDKESFRANMGVVLAAGGYQANSNGANSSGSTGGSDDSKDVTSASVSYAVASGVTAILGYTSVEAADEGVSSTDGSAWYIGANMAF